MTSDVQPESIKTKQCLIEVAFLIVLIGEVWPFSQGMGFCSFPPLIRPCGSDCGQSRINFTEINQKYEYFLIILE